MTKVTLKDLLKDVNQKAGVVLSETERVKRNADIMLQMLKQQETVFLRQEEDERLRQKHEEQQQMIQAQTKAWTMLDEEEIAILEQAEANKVQAELTTIDTEVTQKMHTLDEVSPSLIMDQEEKSFVEAESVSEKVQEKKVDTTQEMVLKTVDDKVAPTENATHKITETLKSEIVASNKVSTVSKASQSISGKKTQSQPQQTTIGRFAPASPRPVTQQYGKPVSGEQRYGRPAPGVRQYGRPAPGNPISGRTEASASVANRSGSRLAGQGRMIPKETIVDELIFPVERERISNYDPNKKNYSRKPDPEHVSKSRKQSVRKGQAKFTGIEDEVVRGGKRTRVRKPSAQQLMAPIKIETAYMTQEFITVKDLTERIGRPAGEILKKLLLLGNIATINSELDYDTASLVCSEFDCELILKLEKSAEDQMIEIADVKDAEEDLQPRPPVITIMGHVDHGKTSLLDYIRSTHVTRGEAGGITQHIGAYSVDLEGQKITFLDTPGHEAFTEMRARGAKSTDIAVLVVAADDGVMPQTIEAINHAKAAEVPIIVAINKMDKPEANPERIKQDLTAHNLVSEEWGGDTIMVPVSAKTGEGINTLLEMILLQAEVLQLQANPHRLARGIIIEAKLDKTRGALATVLLKNGTLKIGDNIIAGLASGRVRALLNDKGENVKDVGPGMPVEISGFSTVPQAGDELIVVEDDRLVRQVAKEREDKLKEQRIAASTVTLDNLFQNIKEGEQLTLNVLIKADVQGSAEAVRQSLEKLSNDQVKIHILHSGVGAVTKDDVNLAATANATIIGFNIRPDNNAREMAAKENVDIRLYRVIYQAIEDIEKAQKGLLEPEFKELVLGHAEVRNVFRITGSGTIAGCYVTDGKMLRNQSVRLLRDNIVVFEGKLSSLRRFKDDVREVASGYECGIGLENYNDIKERDIIECYMMEEIER